MKHIRGFGADLYSRPCWSPNKSRAPFPGRFGICPCEERSPCSVCPQRRPISLSRGHGRGPCHKTHPPAVSTASLALWFAVNTRTCREEKGTRTELGISVLPNGHNGLFCSTMTRTMRCRGTGPHSRAQDCANTH